jgi:hypothetical protein
VLAFPSIIEDFGTLDAIKAKEREVIMKPIATPAVSLLRKGIAPALPNSV